MKLSQKQLRSLIKEAIQARQPGSPLWEAPGFEVMDPQEIIENDPDIMEAATACYEAVGGKLNQIMANEFGDLANSVDPYEIADRHIREGIRAAIEECIRTVQGQ